MWNSFSEGRWHWIVFNVFFYLFTYRRLLGIITKKDILKHMAQIANRDPDSILFNWKLAFVISTSSLNVSSPKKKNQKTPVLICTTDVSATLGVHSHCDGRFQVQGGHLMHYSLIVKLGQIMTPSPGFQVASS